jgi:hypothetical protein
MKSFWAMTRLPQVSREFEGTSLVPGRVRQSDGLVKEGSPLNQRHDQTVPVWHVYYEAGDLFRQA